LSKFFAMTELVLTIRDQSDLQKLLPVLSQLKIQYVYRPKTRKRSAKEVAEAIKTILAGADFSYVGDPVAWQREQRRDRELPFYPTHDTAPEV
jgi:hypothetical protein